MEQDLGICRALVDIFSHPALNAALAFRGGAALYKLFLKPAARYSEDIDLVEIRAEPAGDVIGHLRTVLDPWLGQAKWKQSEGKVTLTYRFESEGPPAIPLRLKNRSFALACSSFVRLAWFLPTSCSVTASARFLNLLIHRAFLVA